MAKKGNDNDWVKIAQTADLQDEVEKLAKRANQRLRQIEKSGLAESSAAYRAVERRVYDKKEGYQTSREGNIGFSRKFKEMTRSALSKLKKELTSFLETTTSTVRGYKGAQERAYETYKKRYGSTMTKKEYPRFWGSESVKSFGYKSVLRVMKSTGKNFSEIEKTMNKAIHDQEQTGIKYGTKNLIAKVKAADTKTKRKKR